MAFKLIDLPYPDTELEPAISAETLSYHHGKHHQAYIDKTNKAIEGTDHADKSLCDRAGPFHCPQTRRARRGPFRQRLGLAC